MTRDRAPVSAGTRPHGDGQAGASVDEGSRAARYYEEEALLPAPPAAVFGFLDDHSQMASHMNRPSWMMAGGRMNVEMDEGLGKALGSHIRMRGSVLGIQLFLDEVVTEREPPRRKAWQTVGTPRLIIVGPYRMGFEIGPENGGSRLRLFIDYEWPESKRTRWLGRLLGRTYARWCVRRMIADVRAHFNRERVSPERKE